MAKIDTIVVGASAGGVEALSRFVSLLPANLPAAVFVVLHFPESSISVLPSILSRSGPLPAHNPVDGEAIRPGTIYVAPPGRHMLIHNGAIRLVVGPKENGNRPAIDPLFRTAARSNRNRVVGVLLSGLLDDGTLGQWAVKRHGGRTLCQDPADAAFGDMPRNAIEYGAIETVLPLEALAQEVVRLVGQDVEDAPGEEMPDPTEMTLNELHNLEERGVPSIFVCPKCKGTLFQLEEENVVHYRCHVGHSYLAESLSADQEIHVESALWTALRALKEHNELLKRMASRAERQGFDTTADGYRRKMADGAHQIELLRHVLGLARREVDETAA